MLTYVPGVLAVFAVVSLSFAGLQLYEARQKRIEAQEAMQKATAALKQAETSSKQIDTILKKIEGQAATVDAVAKQAADLEAKLAKKVSGHREISTEGSNFVTGQLRSLLPFKAQINRSLYLGDEGYKLHLQLIGLFKNAGCDVSSTIIPERTYGVVFVWYSPKYEAGNFETNGNVRVEITRRLAQEIGLDAPSEFFRFSTNENRDLLIVVGKHTLE